jgi:hypothetical protein
MGKAESRNGEKRSLNKEQAKEAEAYYARWDLNRRKQR